MTAQGLRPPRQGRRDGVSSVSGGASSPGAAQDCGTCWHRVGLGGSLAAALCSVRKLYSYCGGEGHSEAMGTRDHRPEALLSLQAQERPGRGPLVCVDEAVGRAGLSWGHLARSICPGEVRSQGRGPEATPVCPPTLQATPWPHAEWQHGQACDPKAAWMLPSVSSP